jgi:hypothetical protein
VAMNEAGRHVWLRESDRVTFLAHSLHFQYVTYLHTTRKEGQEIKRAGYKCRPRYFTY